MYFGIQVSEKLIAIPQVCDFERFEFFKNCDWTDIFVIS